MLEAKRPMKLASLRQRASAAAVLLLCALLALAPSAFALPAVAWADEYDQAYVLDNDRLLDESDIADLDSQAESLARDTGVGVYFVTVGSTTGVGAEAYVDTYHDQFGLGVGEDSSAVVLLLCLNEYEYGINAYGSAADKLSASDLEFLSNETFPYLNRSDWSGAAHTFLDDVQKLLTGQGSAATSAGSSEAYTAGTYVIDNYGLFSDSQRAALEASAQELADQYGMGVYLLVVGNMGSMNPSSYERTNFATTYYRENGLGLGSGKDGIMLVVAVDSRDYVTIAYGQGSYSFSDEGIAAMESDVVDELGGNDWYGGAEAYYASIGKQLSYYDTHGGEPYEGDPDPFAKLLGVLGGLVMGAIAGGARVSGDKRAMKTAKERSEANDYLDRRSLNLLVSTDTFLHTTLSKTRHVEPDNDSGGGGGSFGGGGGWGGGGGGGFSSSGGGKF